MKRFWPLYTTNIFGVMNDNFLKTLVCFIAVGWVNPEYKSIVVNATAGSLVLPYLFFSPLAGQLPQYWRKQKIVRFAKIMELPIMLTAILGFWMQNIYVAIGSVLLMGLQSSLFSPSKYGLIKDIGGKDGISEGMGGMEALAFLGMLAGTVLGSIMADCETQTISYILLIAFAIMGIGCSLTIKADEGRSDTDSSANPIRFLRDTAKIVKSYKGMPHIIHLLSLFWWLSASLQTILIIYCADSLDLTATETGNILALMAIGITLGCLLGGKLDRRFFMLGYVPQLGIIDGLLLLAIFLIPMSAIAFAIMITLVAFIGGLFKIPLDAEIQKRIPSSKLNVVLAYFNLVSFIYIFIASGTNIAITTLLPTKYVFLALSFVMIVSSIIFIFDYKSVLCFFGRTHIRAHYDIKSTGRETLETAKGENLLILPMHQAVIDPLMLFAELYDKKMQPLVDENYFKIPVIGHVLGLFDAIEVPDLRRSRKGIEKAQQLNSIIANGLADGANILFYPSGHITTDGNEEIGTRQLAHNACNALPDNTRVIGIRICGLWGSEWSRKGRRQTPSIVLLLLKSALLFASTAIFFMKKRKVQIEYVDITNAIYAWKGLPKVDFNKKLENFYNNGTLDM